MCQVKAFLVCVGRQLGRESAREEVESSVKVVADDVDEGDVDRLGHTPLREGRRLVLCVWKSSSIGSSNHLLYG